MQLLLPVVMVVRAAVEQLAVLELLQVEQVIHQVQVQLKELTVARVS